MSFPMYLQFAHSMESALMDWRCFCLKALTIKKVSHVWAASALDLPATGSFVSAAPSRTSDWLKPCASLRMPSIGPIVWSVFLSRTPSIAPELSCDCMSQDEHVHNGDPKDCPELGGGPMQNSKHACQLDETKDFYAPRYSL